MSPGFWQIIIILVIVILLFGTKRLANIGSDLGSAIKGFKKSMKDGESEADKEKLEAEKPDTDKKN